MKKIVVLFFALLMTVMTANAYDAKDRVPVVGKVLLEKNGLPTDTKFEIVETEADNSNVATTNIIYISSANLAYAGNDNEVAAVVSNEIGHIINGKTSRTKMRNMAKDFVTSKLSSENVIVTAANSEYVANKTNLNDNKSADITGVDMMIQSGYNPLAMVVVVTKMPGSSLEILRNQPANTERAMNIFDYLTYNYPSKIQAGYGCQEYRNFLAYANPIVEERNANSKKLAKFNKQQEKNKKERIKNISKYKTTGTSSWDTSYQLIKAFTESSENK